MRLNKRKVIKMEKNNLNNNLPIINPIKKRPIKEPIRIKNEIKVEKVLIAA